MRIEKKPLARAQRVLKTVASNRSPLPILSNILIRDGYAVATDLESTVKVAVSTSPQTEPPFLVPWSVFKGLKGDVEIAPMLPDPEKPRVKIDDATFESTALDNFPPVPELELVAGRQPINMEHLLLHLRRCDVVRSKGDVSRLLLTGIGVFEDGRIVATDGFRVYYSDARTCYEGRVLAGAVGAVGGQGVLPGVAANVLSAFGWDHAEVGVTSKIVEQDSYAGGEHTKIKAYQSRWCFTANGEAAWLRGLEGKYFAVRDLVPKQFPNAITVGRHELLAAVEKAAKVATNKPHPMVLQAGGSGLRVYAKQEGNEFDG
ncbi:MAG: hypothetical protein M0Z47_00140, partial [Actinomycetota bacterium]|nr:hypothetical protein [Actinomycetota bacterium]